MNTTAAAEPPRPRILVVIEPHAEAERLLRTAKRHAREHSADWEVVCVEPLSGRRGMTLEEKRLLLQTLTLAEQMGAIVTRMQARTPLLGVQTLLAQRKSEGISITYVLVGVAPGAYWTQSATSLADTPWQRVVDKEIQVILVPLSQEIVTRRRLPALLHVNVKEILVSLAAVVAATAFIYLLNFLWPDVFIAEQHRNKSIIYMVACAFAAIRYGLLAGMVAAVASFLAMGVLFVGPYLTLSIGDTQDAANLAIFLLATVAISFFSNAEHALKEELFQRAERFRSLLRLHRITLNKQTPVEAVQVLDEELSKLLGTDIAFFLPSVVNPDQLETLLKPDLALSEADRKALDVCWAESKTTGVGSPYDPYCGWRFEPLITAQDEIGVLGVRVTDAIMLDAAFGQLLGGIADQAALILERLELDLSAEETRMQAEREKLRAMLLSSVSHDLKTPLASVIGSLSVFRSMRARLSEDQQLTLINTALEEARRLDSFITNILDMTRIESGQVHLKQEWINPHAIVGEVLKRLQDRLSRHVVQVNGSGNDIEVSMDGMMTGQVLQNLLDNAAKYTPPGTRVEVSWIADGSGFSCEIRDFGPGIPEDQFEKVFDKYARIHRQDSQVAGTGLGLAIAKAVMQAQGGGITARNHPEGGAVFTLWLPHWRVCQEEEEKTISYAVQ